MCCKCAKVYGRIGAVLSLSILLAVISLLPMEAQSSNEWVKEIVDAGGFVLSLAYDASGNPHLAYDWGGQIKYAYRSGGAWHVMSVDAGWYPSLALNSDGQPCISYAGGDYSTSSLKYARWTGSAWSIQTVDARTKVGAYTSLDLDSQGHPHISYADRNNYTLKYATFDGAHWITETIDTGMTYASEHSSLALDNNDIPHIAYYAGGDLRYASRTGGVWTKETVDSAGTTGFFCSLAFDSHNKPHISYWSATGWQVKYATRPDATWQITDVAVGSYTSLDLDPAGHPHLIYWDGAQNTANHAWYDGMQWYTETIGTAGQWGGENWRFTIAVDSEGRPGVGYFGEGISLTYAIRQMATPSVALIPTSGGTLPGSDGTLLTFPAGAVSATVWMTYTPTTIAQPVGLFSIGRAYSLTAVYRDTGRPAQLVPGQNYTVIVRYAETGKGAAIEDTLALYYWNGNRWVKEETSRVDTVANRVTAMPAHFSLWAVLGETRQVFLPVVLRGR